MSKQIFRNILQSQKIETQTGVVQLEVKRGRWKCRSGKIRSDNGWKAVRKEKKSTTYKIPTTW